MGHKLSWVNFSIERLAKALILGYMDTPFILQGLTLMRCVTGVLGAIVKLATV
jgi:hypothetical protein